MTAPMFDNVIAGKAVPAISGDVRDILDPTTGEVYGHAAESNAADVDTACAAAAEAFLGWRRTTPAERSSALLAAADLLAQHRHELTDLEVRDTGKPWQVTYDDEIPPSLDQIRFFAGAARVPAGLATGEYADGVTSGIRREPVGVCGQVAPWNYPFMMAVWKWAPAVAAGNTVVLKPSELTPASTVRMAELLAQVLPPGVVNVVCGGAETGAAIAAHPTPAMVSITGSVRAGQAVARAAADSLKRVHLELGGNAPVVVFADADLPAAVEQIAYAAFFNAGQDCTAATRVLVESSAYDEVVGLLADAAAATRTGDPHDEGVLFGPLVSAAHLARVNGFLDRLPAHARIAAGGAVLDRPGWFHQATVVADVRQDDEIVQQEVFGPVLTVQRFDGDDEAVRHANGVPYGLSASVWTSSHSRAVRFLRDLDFGAVSINAHAPMMSEMPHGGFGMSGYGKDLGLYGYEDYTRIKHIAQAWA